MATAKNNNEKTLWDAFRAGEREAFSRLFFDYYEPLYHYGYRICADADLIKDVLQDFFLHLYEQRAGLNADVRNLKAYLLSAFLHRLFQELRQQQKLGEKLSLPGAADGSSFTLGMEDIIIARESAERNKELINRLLAELPPRQREIIYLKFYLDLSLPEMAETLQISYQVVANHLHRALRKLQGSETVRKFFKLDVWLLLCCYPLWSMC